MLTSTARRVEEETGVRTAVTGVITDRTVVCMTVPRKRGQCMDEAKFPDLTVLVVGLTVRKWG